MALRLFLTAFGTGVFLVLFLVITATTLLKSEPSSVLTSTPTAGGLAAATATEAPDVGVTPSPEATEQVQALSTAVSPEPVPTETVAPEPSPTPVPETQPAEPGVVTPPSGLSVTYSARQGVVLSWNEVAGVAYYNVYRSQVLGGGPGATYTAIGSSGAPFFVDGTALSGQSYYYVVTASGAGIESDSSNEASIRVP